MSEEPADINEDSLSKGAKMECAVETRGNALASKTAMCVVLCCICPIVPARSADTDAAATILDQVLVQYHSLPVFASRVETRVPLKDNSKGIDAEVHVRDVRWDGDRYDVVISRYEATADTLKQVYSKRALWTGSQYQFRQKATNSPADEYPVAFVSSSKQYMMGVWNSPYSGAFLSGILPGHSDHVAKVLRERGSVEMRDDLEEVAGHPCRVIEGTVGKSHYQLWVDPNSGFSIRKAVAKVQGDRDPASQTYELDGVTIEKTGDVYIVTAGTLKSFSESGRMIQCWEAKRPSIQFNPDFDEMGAFKMDLPNGTKVDSRDFPAARFEWRDGNLVTDIDEEFISSLDNQIADMITAPNSPSEEEELPIGRVSTVAAGSQSTTDFDSAQRQGEVASATPGSSPGMIAIVVVALLSAGISGWMVLQICRRHHET